MKQITLNIPEENYSFFVELMKSLRFIDKAEIEGSSKEEILEGLKQSVKELNLIKSGQLNGIPARDLLNEL